MAYTNNCSEHTFIKDFFNLLVRTVGVAYTLALRSLAIILVFLQAATHNVDN